MPVVLRESGLSYFFFSNEGLPRETPHIHVRGGGRSAKIWLDPEPAVAESRGFKSGEISRILLIVRKNRSDFKKAWYEHLGNSGSL